MTHLVRLADADDAAVIGRLLYDFNREFDEPAPEPAALAERLRQLIEGGDTLVLLAGDGPDGLAVLRFRAAIWSAGLECYLAELYVAPASRGQGLGRALMEAAMQRSPPARRRHDGHRRRRAGPGRPPPLREPRLHQPGRRSRAVPLMYVYERDLGGASPGARAASRRPRAANGRRRAGRSPTLLAVIHCAGRATGRRAPGRSGPAAPEAGVPRRTGARAARR